MDAYSSTQVNLEYSSDVLSHFSKRVSSVHSAPYSIPPQLRERLVDWIFDTCFELKGSSKTGQLAVVLFDLFISRREVVGVYKLVAAVTLMLAFKFEERLRLSPCDVVEMCRKTYALAAVVTTERFMLDTLNWDLLQPTAAEALPYQLVATGDFEALSGLIKRCDAYAAWCYSDAELAKQGAQTIAAASFCCVLAKIKALYTNKGGAVLKVLPESMHYIFEGDYSSLIAFISTWLEKLETHKLIAVSTVEKCWTALEYKLSELMAPTTVQT
jgi:hypothetical protein